jgi:hypothetical protein
LAIRFLPYPAGCCRRKPMCCTRTVATVPKNARTREDLTLRPAADPNFRPTPVFYLVDRHNGRAASEPMAGRVFDQRRGATLFAGLSGGRIVAAGLVA